MTTEHSHTDAPHHDAAPHHTSAGFYALIYVVLMVLLVITVWAASWHVSGHLPVLIAMSIATIKTVLILMFFMHVKGGPKRAIIFALAGFLWLALLGVMTAVDYQTRGETGLNPKGDPIYLNPPATDARADLPENTRDHEGSLVTYPVFAKRELP